jgi:hypothetical protein
LFENSTGHRAWGIGQRERKKKEIGNRKEEIEGAGFNEQGVKTASS